MLLEQLGAREQVVHYIGFDGHSGEEGDNEGIHLSASSTLEHATQRGYGVDTLIGRAVKFA